MIRKEKSHQHHEGVRVTGKGGLKAPSIARYLPVPPLSRESVIPILATATHPELRTRARAAYLRWLTIAFPALSPDAQQTLREAFAAVFHLLRYDLSLAPAALLLARLCRPHHVSPHRLYFLLLARRRLGLRPHLLALLQLFADLSPAVCPEPVPLPDRRVLLSPLSLAMLKDPWALRYGPTVPLFHRFLFLGVAHVFSKLL